MVTNNKVIYIYLINFLLTSLTDKVINLIANSESHKNDTSLEQPIHGDIVSRLMVIMLHPIVHPSKNKDSANYYEFILNS